MEGSDSRAESPAGVEIIDKLIELGILKEKEGEIVERPIGPSVLPNDWDGDGVSDNDEMILGTNPWIDEEGNREIAREVFRSLNLGGVETPSMDDSIDFSIKGVKPRIDDAEPSLMGAEECLRFGRESWLSGSYFRAEGFFREGIKLSRTQKEREVEAHCLRYLGNISHSTGDSRTAQKLFTESLEIMEEIDNLLGQAFALNNLGALEQENLNYVGARHLYTKAINIFRILGKWEAIPKTLRNVGLTYAYEDPERLAEITLASLEFSRNPNLEYEWNISDITNGLLQLSWYRRNHEDDMEGSVKLLEEAMEIIDEENDSGTLTNAYIQMASIKIKQEKFDDALVSANAALNLSRRMRTPFQESRALGVLGDISNSSYRTGGGELGTAKLKEAVTYYERSLNIVRGLGKIDDQIHLLADIADVSIQMDNFQRAEMCISEAMEITDKMSGVLENDWKPTSVLSGKLEAVTEAIRKTKASNVIEESQQFNPKEHGWNTFPCIASLSSRRVSDSSAGKILSFEVSDNIESRKLIRKFPKSDLHCHVGGILSIDDQIDVGRSIWDEMGDEERNDAVNQVRNLLELAKKANKTRTVWPNNWSQEFLSRDLGGEIRSMRAATLLTQIPSEQLESLLFPSIEDRWLGRVQMRIDGFDDYPLPGELMGSTLLASKSTEALKKYCLGITEYCKSDNIRYIEIRLSPTKYRHDLKDQIHFVLSFSKFLNSSMRNKNYEYTYGLIISGDRRHFSDDIEGRSRFDEFLALLSKLSGDKISREIVLGFDIAGAEEEFDLPEYVSAGCRKIQRETNLQFTLHSGEQSSVDNLHQALDSQPSRIGHGLKFEDDPKLMMNCVRRRIALEMCPTSNIEVHGFAHPDIVGMLPTYPLREYLDAGLRVCICTDNPFISRTDSTNEYIMASMMIGGINLVELLGVIWDSFECAFLPRNRKIKLQTSIDEEIRIVLEKEFGTDSPL